jgi:hypothetical protein
MASPPHAAATAFVMPGATVTPVDYNAMHSPGITSPMLKQFDAAHHTAHSSHAVSHSSRLQRCDTLSLATQSPLGTSTASDLDDISIDVSMSVVTVPGSACGDHVDADFNSRHSYQSPLGSGSVDHRLHDDAAVMDSRGRGEVYHRYPSVRPVGPTSPIASAGIQAFQPNTSFRALAAPPLPESGGGTHHHSSPPSNHDPVLLCRLDDARETFMPPLQRRIT